MSIMNNMVKEKQIITDFPFKVKVIDHDFITLSDGTKLAVRM